MQQKSMLKKCLICLLILLLSISCGKKETPTVSTGKMKQLQWFQGAKFGMFIHWGVYSMIGFHEWARHRLQIPLEEYQYYVDNFNPVQFNPDEWVMLAKDAGMQYMVITSKHHDGFCLFDSDHSDYDIGHAKYGKDVLGMLSESAKQLGMPLGFYYSIMDWHHDQYLPYRNWETDREPGDADLNRYINWMKLQLTELVTRYDPFVLWFDGQWEHTPDELHSDEIQKMLLTLKPDLLINDRLWGRKYGKGDFGTPENYVPATGLTNEDGTPRLWEACYTLNFNSWGYNHIETEFHSTGQLIRQLIEIVSKGGNLLLNVGPTPQGTIQPDFVERLQGIGEWLKVNGKAIYGTTASVFPKLPFYGRSTTKGDTLYLHVMGWPEDRQLLLPGLQTEVTKAYLLADSTSDLAHSRNEKGVVVELPPHMPDGTTTVVAVELAGTPVVDGAFQIKPATDGSVNLPVYMAEIKSRMGQRAYLEQFYKTTMLTNWQSVYDMPVWEFTTETAGSYEIKLSYARGSIGSEFVVKIDDNEIPGAVANPRSPFLPDTFTIGTVNLGPGTHTLVIQLKSIKRNNAMRLEKVELVPLSK